MKDAEHDQESWDDESEPEKEDNQPEGYVPGPRRYAPLSPRSPEIEERVREAWEEMLRSHRRRLPGMIEQARKGIPRGKKELFKLISEVYPVQGGLLDGESAWNVLWASGTMPTPRKLFDAVVRVSNAPGWAEAHERVLIGEFLRKRMWDDPVVEAPKEPKREIPPARVINIFEGEDT